MKNRPGSLPKRNSENKWKKTGKKKEKYKFWPPTGSLGGVHEVTFCIFFVPGAPLGAKTVPRPIFIDFMTILDRFWEDV